MTVNTTGDLKMRGLRFLVPLFLVATGWAADPFLGNWRLNVAKSDFGSGPRAQSGSATYETGSGGYMYSSETVYSEDNKAGLRGPVQFDGTVNEGGLDGRAVTFVSKKIDDSAYDVILTDKETGKVSHTFKYMVSPDGKTLAFTWMKAGDDKPFMKLVYDKQ
jgi:hypothetical protein